MRIAHFSDLHLLSVSGATWLDFANKRWIGGMNLLVRRGRHYRPEIFEAMVTDLNELGVDQIVCTGDVTNLALDEEFRFARGYFDALRLGPEHVTVVPGNHDAYVADGAEAFSRHFGPFCSSDEAWAGGGEGGWPAVRVRGRLALIGVSTSMQTPWFTAYGRVGEGQRERLRAVLADERLRGCFRVVLIHHPPAGSAARSRVRGLYDRDELGEVLAETGAELVLHGHQHQDLYHELAGPGGVRIPVRGIQAGSYDNDQSDALRARYRIYEIADASEPPDARPPLAGDALRVWDPDTARFVDDSSPVRAAAG